MKPTKEQLADPKWWRDNVPSGFDYAYTTGPDWKYSELSKGDICFGDSNGLCPDEESGEFDSLILGLDGWIILAKRPEPEQWKQKAPLLPDIGTEVEIIDNGSLVYGQGESGEVIGHIENCAIVRMSYGLGCFEASYLKIKKTQREEFIEEAKSRIKNMDADDIILTGKLYDAGCRFDLTEKDGE